MLKFLKRLLGRNSKTRGRENLSGPTGGVTELLGSIRSSTRARHTVLDPIVIGDTAILPLARFRLAVGTGGSFSAGGGGAATACAFLIIKGDEARVVGFDFLEETLSDFLEGDSFNSAVESVLTRVRGEEGPK